MKKLMIAEMVAILVLGVSALYAKQIRSIKPADTQQAGCVGASPCVCCDGHGNCWICSTGGPNPK